MNINDKPIRIAQIIGKLSAGGVETVMYNYYINTDHNLIQYDFFIDEDSSCEPPQELIDMGARYFIIPPYQKIFKYLKVLIKLFKENDYKIVHSGMNTLSVFSLFAAWIAHVPIRISHNHSTANIKEGKRVILKYILRPFSKIFATHYLACSEHAGRWLFGNRTYNKDDVIVINNAIDLSRFKYDPALRKDIRYKLDISDDCFVLGHVGRFMPQKNHDFLIDIFFEITKKIPNSKLLLIGIGELKDAIQNKVNKLGINKNVIFAGSTTNVEKYYQAMDVFCFPSIFEGLGLVAVEAQASCLPVITSEKVPKEVDITDFIKHLSLNVSAKIWADEILKYKNFNRSDSPDLTGSKYDIKSESKKLENLYIFLSESIK